MTSSFKTVISSNYMNASWNRTRDELTLWEAEKNIFRSQRNRPK